MKASKLVKHLHRKCWLPRYLLVGGKLRLLKGPVALKTSAGWQASGGRTTVTLSFCKDALVFRNLLSFSLTVTLSTHWGYGEGYCLGYVKVQENISPTAVNQALGSHVLMLVIQTCFLFHTDPRLKPRLIFHDNCLIIHPIIWDCLAI